MAQTNQSQQLSYEDLVSEISYPLADKDLTEKCYMLISKAIKLRFIRIGKKDVHKGIRKDETGMVLIAGDVTPLDLITHVPALCEEKKLPYCFLPSRADLGSAMGFKRSCIMVMVRIHDDYKGLYEEICTDVNYMLGDISEV